MRMKYILSILVLFMCKNTEAQFSVSIMQNTSINSKKIFTEYLDYYNGANANFEKTLGYPNIGIGYSAKVSYNIDGLFASVARDWSKASTKATFSNGAKRCIEYRYQFTTANIGYYHEGLDKVDFSVEVGIVASNVTIDRYAVLPNKQIDYFANSNFGQKNWINIGANAQAAIYYKFTDNFMVLMRAQYVGVGGDTYDKKPSDLDNTFAFKGINLGIGVNYLFD